MRQKALPTANWVPVKGLWELKNGEAVYKSPQRNGEDPYGIVLSKIELKQGNVRANVTLGEDLEAARIMLGYSPLPGRYITVGLGGYGRAYCISEYSPGVGWIARQLAGDSSNLQAQREYALGVGIKGQRVLLSVDGIPVLEDVLDEPLSGQQVGLFAWGKGEAKFSNVKATSDPATAFVVIQLSDPYFDLYGGVIKPIAESMGLNCYLASEIYGPGSILQDIVQSIVESAVVIAEITPPNPNVFYEVGYAHALKKPTILLADRNTKLPFDVSGYRCIFYEDKIRGKPEVEANLQRHLEAVLRGQKGPVA